MNAGEITIQLTLDGKQMDLQVKNAGQLLRQFKGSLDQTTKSVKRLEDAQFSLSTKFRNLVLTLGNLRFAMLDVYDIFLRLPTSILKTAGELERLETLLKGLSKGLTESARNAEAAVDFKFITDAAQKAPFAITALADSFTKLKIAGLDPTQGSLNALVDSVAKFGGSSEQLKRASVAIQQIAGKGVVSMEELRQQLGEAIPDAIQNMAVALGVTVAQLTKDVSKGMVASQGALERLLIVAAIRNRGAAEQMKETWIGTLAQIETQWQLTAKEVADSGFGDAAKAAVRELGGALGSADFKRFAIDAGSALGSLTSGLLSVVKGVVEYRNSIALLVQGFVGYKLATAFVIPALTAIKNSYSTLVASAAGARAAVVATAVAQQQGAVAAAAAALSQAQASQSTAAAAVASSTAQIAAIERNNAALIRSQALLKANVFNTTAAAYVSNMANINTSLANNQKNLGAVTTALNTNKAALAAAQVATASLAATQTTAAAAAVGMSRGAQIAAVALGGLRAVVGALLSPLTIITTVLTLGAYAWFNYESAAKKAADTLKRVRANLSTAADETGAQSEVDLQRAKLEGLKQQEKALQNSLTRNPANAKATQALLDENLKAQRYAETVLSEGAAKLSKIRASVRDQADSEEASFYERDTKNALDAIQAKSKAEQVTLAAAFEKQKQANSKNQKALAEIALNEKRQLALVELKAIEKIDADLAARKKAIEDKPEASQTSLDKKNLAGLNREIAAAQEARKAASTLLVDYDYLNPSDPKKKKDGSKNKREDPLLRFLENLEEQQAKMRALTPGLIDGSRALDVGLAAYDEVIEKYNNGDFANGGKFSLLDPEAIAELARTNAELKQAQKSYGEIAERVRADQPEVQAAVAYLLNPLGPRNTPTKNSEDLASFLNKQGISVETYAARLGKSVPEVVGNFNKLRSGAALKDLADIGEKINEDLTEIGDETVAGQRRRAIQQINIESDKVRRLLVLKAEEAKAFGTPTEADAAESALQKFLQGASRLNTDRVIKASRTPMDKLLEDWKDTAGQMERVTADFAQGGIDMFVNFAKTGKFEFKSLVISVLADIAKIQLQKNLGPAFEALFKIGSSFFTGGGSTPSLPGVVLGGPGFAMGGIMSSSGSLPLKKYAKGGIAKSPQMAIFGEGAQNEAYVPLPDGRSIPVTMKGGAGDMPAVTVNVINQTSQSVTAEQGTPRFDGRQMVLDVVLSAANKPGPFRDGLRNSVRN